MGIPRQEWAIVWPNSSVFILFIPRTFPQSFIKIWWTKFAIYWKRCILGPNIAQFGPEWWACPVKNGLTCEQTHQSSFFSHQEHSLKVLLKSGEPNSRYIGRRSFWTRLSQLPPAHFCPFCPFSQEPDFSQKIGQYRFLPPIPRGGRYRTFFSDLARPRFFFFQMLQLEVERRKKYFIFIFGMLPAKNRKWPSN